MPTSKPGSPGAQGNAGGNGGSAGGQGGHGHNNGNGPGNGGGSTNPYARFIPREELGSFSAWNPQTFEQPVVDKQDDVGVRKPTLAERAAAELRPPMKGAQVKHAAQTMGSTAAGTGAGVGAGKGAAGRAAPASAPSAAGPATGKPSPQQPKPAVRRPIVGGVPGEEERHAPPPPPPAPPPVDIDALVREARHTGYQDGYRNGLAALESYKQTQAAQMAAYMSDQVGALAADFHHRLESLEQQLAGRIAGVALELARQVVRTELLQRPEVVVEVAEQALGALLTSARQIMLRLNPEDHAMAQGQLAEMLAARGARLVPDAGVTRGGCIVESDIAVVDASVEGRWERAASAMGHQAPWNAGHEAMESTEIKLADDEDDEAADWPIDHAHGQGVANGAQAPQADEVSEAVMPPADGLVDVARAMQVTQPADLHPLHDGTAPQRPSSEELASMAAVRADMFSSLAHDAISLDGLAGPEESRS